jgi:hypothetical protein
MRIPGIYTQRDPRWSNNLLGFNTEQAYNMYHFGCLVTAIANLMWYTGNSTADPGAVNQWMKDNGGFAPGGGLAVWGALAPLLAETNVVAHGFSADLNAVNAFLAPDNNYAIAWLTKPGFPMHWSIMPYVGQIADSWDGVLKPVGSYTFKGAYLYTKVVPAPIVAPPITPGAATIPLVPVIQPVPVVVPVPPVVEPPVIPPVEAPQPHPVETVTVPQKDPSQLSWFERLLKIIRVLFGVKE